MDRDVLTAVSRLTDALSRATSLEEVYTASLDALQNALGVLRASVLLFDDDDVMQFVAWRGLSDRYRSAVTGHSPWRPDSSDPEPVCVRDVDRAPTLAPYDALFRSEGIRALGFFPLLHRGRVLGKFMLYYSETHDFSAEEIALANVLAGQIAFGVARIRAEQALERERERLADIIRSVPGVVWEATGTPGVDQRVSFVSDHIVDLLGYPLTDWYQEPHFWSKVIVSADEPEIERLARETAATDGHPSTHRYRMRARDGRLLWTEVRTASKREGNRLVMRGVTMDITAQREAEERNAFLNNASALLASSLDYETTLSHLAQLTVANLADWCVIDLLSEEGAVERLAVVHRDPSRAAAAERARVEFPPATHELGLARKVIETGQPAVVGRVDEETRRRFRSLPVGPVLDELGYESYMIVPLSARGRALGAFSIISADPARRYDAQDLDFAAELGRRASYAIENARLYRAAQEANRAKDEFLATLSHELRTPMTATLGWATMLRMHDLSPDNFKLAVDTIERSTRAQAKLIDEILDVSRIVTGKLQLTTLPVNLAQIVEAAVDTVRPNIVAKGIDLHLSVGPMDGSATGDAGRLQQVIWNLLSNSVKFTPPGGSISVTLKQLDSGMVSIAVRDSGSGIPRKFLPHIFERFRQADSSASRAQGGLGLGLAIVKNIVELHGGSVVADSAGEGKGATFTIMLPVGAATEQTPAHAVGAASSMMSLSGVAVLLVEDEDDTRRMLAAALQNFGANVIAVSSAPAAIDALRIRRPHVVVSDIAMPGEDGFGLIGKIRSGVVEFCSDVPAIALTAYARPEDRARALASGFGYHLSKPVDPLKFAQTVREAASG